MCSRFPWHRHHNVIFIQISSFVGGRKGLPRARPWNVLNLIFSYVYVPVYWCTPRVKHYYCYYFCYITGNRSLNKFRKHRDGKEKRHSTTTKTMTTGWISQYDVIIYVETSAVEKENIIKKREITILYTETDVSPAGTF